MAITATQRDGFPTSTTLLRRLPEQGEPRVVSRGQIWHRWVGIAIAVCLQGACVDTKFQTNAPKRAHVVADEAAAAVFGRELLTQGGNAADAAAGMAMTMVATLPSRVGLGGGGVCVVFDAAAKTARTLDFLPRAGTATGDAAPSFLRAMVALQASNGRMRWEQVAVHGETLALGNASISRGLAEDIAAAAGRLHDPVLKRMFLPNGQPLGPGQRLAQPDLAATLSLVRRNGFQALQGGRVGDALAAGLGLGAAGERGAPPRWSDTVAIERGSFALHFAALPEPASGRAMAAAWPAVAKTASPARGARIAELLNAGGGEAAPGAGFAVIDSAENAVACAFTQGALFGQARVVPGTGILAARPVDSAGFGAPAVLANTIVGRARFAGIGTAAGGDGPAGGPIALLDGAGAALLDERDARAIVAARTAATGPGRLGLITCEVSADSGVQTCQSAGDERAGGVGYVVDTGR